MKVNLITVLKGQKYNAPTLKSDWLFYQHPKWKSHGTAQLDQLACGYCSLIACSQTSPSIDSPIEVEDTSLDIENCEVQAVFENNGCLDCHGSNAELNGGGINLTEAHIESSLIGASSNSPGCENEFLVNVDHPEASILLHTLSPEEYADAIGPDCSPMPMPLGGMNTVPMEDVGCIEEWINTLEPNTETPDVLFEAPALTVLTRIKYLLDGGAWTAEELESASGKTPNFTRQFHSVLQTGWPAIVFIKTSLELHLQQPPAMTTTTTGSKHSAELHGSNARGLSQSIVQLQNNH